MTYDELNALPDSELNRLSGPIMGWRFVAKYDYRQRDCWLDSDENCTYTDEDWHPATDRNQSGQLLARMIERGVRFTIYCWSEEPEVAFAVPHTEVIRCVSFAVPGNSARSETIAALLAHFAMQEDAR